MNWDIVSGPKGKVYFGNNYGLMAYDGAQWDLVLEPDNRTNVSALGIDLNNTLFLGAFDELGHVVQNALGQVNYQSLNPLIPAQHRGYGLVWQVLANANAVYFFTSTKIFIYDGRQMAVVTTTPGHDFTFAQKTNGTIYVQQRGMPLAVLKAGQLQPVKGTFALAAFNVRALFQINNSLVVCTAVNGLYQLKNGQCTPWAVPLAAQLQGTKISFGRHLMADKLAIVTIKQGLYICNTAGQVLLHITKESGLQNQSIQAVYEDATQNLWLALTNGVAYIELGSDFYYLDNRSGIDGSVYSTFLHHQQLYLATNNGLYTANINHHNGYNGHQFSYIDGTDAHGWYLTQIKGHLLLGNHDGAFEITPSQQAHPLNTGNQGAWQFVQHPFSNDLMFQGSYHGIFIYRYLNGRWQLQHKLPGFDETARELVFDQQGHLWVGHGYHGIYRIALTPGNDSIAHIDLFNTERGLPDNLWNNLFYLRNQVLVGTRQGVYEWNPETDQMQPNTLYQDLLGSQHLVRRLVAMPDGNVFFIKGLDNHDQMGIIHENTDYQVQTIPFQKLRGELIPAFESITFYHGQILFGAKDGLIIYKQSINRPSPDFQTNINRVFCSPANDSIIYGHPEEYTNVPYPANLVQQLPYQLNALKITWSAAFFERANHNVYRTYLEGYDNEWTQWKGNTTREFTNLKEGNYVFNVESKNIYGTIGLKDTFKFSIAPPWYRAPWMYATYSILGLLLLVGIVYARYKKLHALEARRIEALARQQRDYQRKSLEAEQKMNQLKMEKMQAEIDYKSKELAASALHLANHNDTVLRIINRVKAIEVIKDNQVKQQLGTVVQSLKELISEEGNWEQFELHFNEIHNNFIQRLKSNYPDLTARDIRLCAYLRMNLASKEIAPLMGISYRGVEALRYRIRKKLHLATQHNLTEFILGY